MRVKDASVDITGLRTPIRKALGRLDAYHKLKCAGRHLYITSGSEHIKHSVERSAHYRGDAVDIRNWYLAAFHADISLDTWAERISTLLGPDFVVINEGTHFHIHWSPVYQASLSTPRSRG